MSTALARSRERDGAGGSGVDKIYYTTGVSPADPTTSSSVYNPAAKPTLAAFTSTRAVTTGQHTVRVEYYEKTGQALIQVSW